MKNRIIEVFPLKPLGLVSVTVENPDFSNSKPDSAIHIGERQYKFHNIVMGRGQSKIDTFTIEYTEDELLDEQVVF